MNPTAHLIVASLCLGVCALLPTAAGADRAGEVKKQKVAAEANGRKAGLVGLTHVETDDLRVYAAVPDGKAKPLAEALQKTFELGRTTLKFAPDEKSWPGKLTAFVLTDPVQFTNYVRLVEQRRPDKGVAYAINVRGDQPYVISSVEPGGRATDAELTAEAAAVVGAAVLTRKAGPGADVPEWLALGFGRAAAVRADGNPTRLAAYRSRARAAVLGTKTKPAGARPIDVWGGLKTKDSPVIAASFVEYLAFGPEAEKFPKFVTAFKPGDNMLTPTPEAALADAGWKPEALEIGWKQWVAKQK